VKFNPKQQEWVPVAPSTDHIGAFLDRGSWTILRPLDAIARAPFLREDGSICDAPGYDPASRTLYIRASTSRRYLTTRRATTRWQRSRACGSRSTSSPGKRAASESAFVSHILAEAARLAMERCPMYFYDAPMAGTGKSTLQEMAARIVHGTEPAMRPCGGGRRRAAKVAYACLMAGDRSIWFDNVPDAIKVRFPYSKRS